MRLRTLAPIFLVLILLGCAAAPAHVASPRDPLPESIKDETFWKMVTDFSEPGGTFDFEMFMSNEVTFQEVLPDLLRRVTPGGVYLGVAPEQNFTYIAALRPKMAFIIDIRRENMIEHLMYKAMFELSPTRADFLALLFSRKIPADLDPQISVDGLFASLGSARSGDDQLFARNLQSLKDHLHKTHGFTLTDKDDRVIDQIYGAFFRGGPEASLTTYGTSYRLLMLQTDGQNQNRNFLVSNSNYEFVRQMEQKNLIVPVVGDFTGPKTIRAVASYLREHDAEVSAFYVSNVEEYISSPQSKWSAWCGNVAALPINASSTFIRFGRGGQGSFLGAMSAFIKQC